MLKPNKILFLFIGLFTVHLCMIQNKLGKSLACYIFYRNGAFSDYYEKNMAYQALAFN